MNFSGVINWGPVHAFIILTNVQIVNSTVVYADVEIHVNGHIHTYTIENQH